MSSMSVTQTFYCEARVLLLPSSCPCLLCDRETGLKWNGKDPLSAAVGITHDQTCVLNTITL